MIWALLLRVNDLCIEVNIKWNVWLMDDVNLTLPGIPKYLINSYLRNIYSEFQKLMKKLLEPSLRWPKYRMHNLFCVSVRLNNVILNKELMYFDFSYWYKITHIISRVPGCNVF